MIGISNKPSRKFNSIYYTPTTSIGTSSNGGGGKQQLRNDFPKNHSDFLNQKMNTEHDEKKNLHEKNGNLSIIERILQEQSKEITQLRAEIVELRDELHLSTLGSILVRFVKDSVFEENTVAIISQGTQMELKSPFNENEKGLWASRQIMGITSDGMEIRSDMVLIAKRIGEGEFEPLVEIVEK
jgi:hypothetical protein